MAQIKTYARLKPTKKPFNGYVISKNVLTMHIPDNKDFVILGPQNNCRSNFIYDILFTNIFGCEASQEEVFDGVAKDIINNFLNGYNGTIFAYGQTGTGKTYTVEGNTSKYSARGLATRALSMIYQELEKRSDQHISVYLSYLEIYQEVAYDLLNPAARSNIPIAPFARVTVVEGPRGSCILRGLSLHLAANEEIAQMLLLQGQANRKVAETPVNQRSSRSHAVFTVYLQIRKHDSDVLVNSKLHLVDLAGSERVSKTGVDGQQLTEAKSINLSLHHLETVIIALQVDKTVSASNPKGENPPQQSKSSSLMSSGPSSDNGGSRQLRFVPYRNSLLTMVLKDSLGGNCLTAMIATISLEPENLGESISTCRFAQRVARIANNARRNEEVNDKALIKRLKNKVAYLENQVAILRSKGRADTQGIVDTMDVLTDEDHHICERVIEGFLQGVIADPIEAGISDQCRFRVCLQMLKHQYLQRQNSVPGGSPPSLKYRSAPSASSSTLQPGPSSSWAERLANNPQQDSGDYAGVRTAQSQRQQAASGLPDSGSLPKRSEGLADSSHSEKCDDESHPVRTSEPFLEDSKVSSMTHSGVDGGDSRGNNSTSYTTWSGSGKKGRTSTKSGTNETDQPHGNSGTLGVVGARGGGGAGGAHAAGYKSPYEMQREKEIRRLSRKLTEMEEDKASRENNLQEMKEQAIVEELLVAEAGFRLKLQVAEEQVADQHAYLLQLKHLQADPDLIAKEQLVEKQLRKRQAKFHEKLAKVLASKESMEKEFAQQRILSATSDVSQQLQQQAHGSRDISSKTSLEERFGQYKQGKGSLNTRQVFDLLKNQEKKQQKESQKVERETTLVKTKQLAIKEAATLEKLRELKQMLKLSLLKEEQQQQQQHPLSNSNLNRPAVDAAGGLDVAAGYELSAEAALKNNDGFLTNNRVGGSPPDMGSRGGGASFPPSPQQGGKQQAWARTKSKDQNQSHHNSTFSASALLNPKMSEMSPPPASHSFYEPRNSFKFFDNKESKSTATGSDNFSNSPNKVHGRDANTNNASATEFGEPSGDRELLLSDLEPMDRYSVMKENVYKNHQTHSNGLQKPNGVSHNVSNSEEDQPNLSNGIHSHVVHQSIHQPPVVPPSEYIHSMSSQDQFDARRMGLSSRTFESALSHMLDQANHSNAPNLPYTVDPYQGFSRSSDHQRPQYQSGHSALFQSPYLQNAKRPTNRQQKIVRESQSLGTDAPGNIPPRTRNARPMDRGTDHKSAWGPESKNMSVADRLANLLETPSSFFPAEDDKIVNGSAEGKRQSGTTKVTSSLDAFETKLAEFKRIQNSRNNSYKYHQNERDHNTVEDDDEEEDRSFLGVEPAPTKLRAMTEEEGEKTFLSAVAAEKARVEKIRRARNAAEVIQRQWRKFRTQD